MTALTVLPLLGLSAALAQEPDGEAVPPSDEAPDITGPSIDRDALIELLREEIRAEIRAELSATHAMMPPPAPARAPTQVAPAPAVSGFGGRVVRVEEGQVVASAVGFGAPVEVAGRVSGDATSFGADVRVLPTGVVEGDAVSFGGDVLVDPGGVVRGSRVGMGRGHLSPEPLGAPARSWLSGLMRRLVVFLSFAGAGVLVVGLFPNRVGHIAGRIRERPIGSLVVGTAAVTGLLLGAFVFGITIVGLPVTFLLVALLGLAWLMGFVGICQAVGDRLPFERKVHGRWLAFLAGTLLVAFLGSLPFIGIAAVAVASVLGIGAALTTRLGAV